jgi:hypothetical protein
MSIKIIMNWDIKPGRDQEYFEFVVREWVPGITKLGLQATGAWYTVYSREPLPQIMTEGIARDLPAMRRILDSGEWQSLYEKLQDYVSNYEQKIVHTTGGFQI